MARQSREEVVVAMKVRSEPQNARGAWEYLVITGDAESPELLAECGALGWELVTVVREFGTRATFYFKRRRG
jgi:hypothetical protein